MKISFEELLKDRKLSLTSVRLAVLEAVHQNQHCDASLVYKVVRKKITTASKQAIYNNLNTLVQEGLLREIKPKGHASLFETRTGDRHHHLICRSCNTIVDAECRSPSPLPTPAQKHGFVIDETEVVFWGTCSSCNKKSKKNQKGDPRGKN